jgi:signal transduction histidine kinase
MDRFRLLEWAAELACLGTVGVCLAAVLLTLAILILLGGIGIPLLLGALPWLHSFADWHRIRFARLTGTPVDRPYLPPSPGSWTVRLSAAAADPANWRDSAWLLVNGTAGIALCLLSLSLLSAGLFYLLQPAIWPLAPGVVNAEYGLFTVHDLATSFLTVPLGAAALLLCWWWTPALVRADARIGRWLLAPDERSRLASRVRQLAQTRAQTIDAHAAELRRVERDLHDGAQARLVGLGMNLGMADELIDTDPAQARELLREARSLTGAALSDLRNLVRGIRPPVLIDLGLQGAIEALALAVPIPVSATVDLPGDRLPLPLESAAYFAVAEVLANVVKHSAASTAWIAVRQAGRNLSIEVGDDGVGGANPARGSGLRGIEGRLAAFDGTLSVSSPAGGPTLVRMELPCEPLSLRISPCCATA